MNPASFALLTLAGVATGLVGYLTGLASLVSYPSLLAAGLAPVAANATNTLALIGAGFGSTARAAGVAFDDTRTRTIQQFVITVAGGTIGSLLLLWAGDSVFELLVPWLVGIGAVMFLASPRLARLRGDRESWGAYLVVLFFVTIYGGYFGAGAGVLLMATTALLTRIDFRRSLVLKSMLLGVANLVAAVIFIVSGAIDWWAALALGLGCIAGGALGPPVQALIPDAVLRPVVGIAGIGMALWLALR